MSEWKKIESAPRDGRNVMLWADGAVIAKWSRQQAPAFPWLTDGGSEAIRHDIPTHWMPLPNPPQS